MPASKASDKPYIWLVRGPQGLVGYSEHDRDIVERYRRGSHIVCTLEQPRDERMNRKFHGLIGLVAKAKGMDRELLKSNLMVQAGCYHSVVVLDGIGTSFTPKSVTELEQDAFAELYWRIVEIIIRDHLPHLPPGELVQRINDYIGVAA